MMTAMTAEDDVPPGLQDLFKSIEDEGLDPEEVAQRLRKVLDALEPGPGAVDVPMRRKVAEIADGLDLPGS